MSKPKVIKAYDAVDNELKIQLREEYPYGFDKHLILFKDAQGKLVSALPYEAEDRFYLIKMTSAMAVAMAEIDYANSIIDEEDDDDSYDEVLDLVGEDVELEIEDEDMEEEVEKEEFEV